MASVQVYPDRVVIQLTASEKALAMRRRDVVISRDRITSALITGDPWIWLRGVRAPGAHVPRRIAVGTWRNLAGRDFAVVRRGRPAVVVDLDTVAEPGSTTDRGGFDDFARVILSTRHAAELVRALRLGADPGVFTTDTEL